MNAARIERIWYGGEAAPWWLRALVPVYRLLRLFARAPWQLGLRRAARLPVPVIVVGNLTVGGTGKTPLVIALVEALRARGFHPGVVSRGYGGRARAAVLLDDHPDPVEVGDEPSLVRRRTRVPVAVGRDRGKVARLLLAQGVDVIISDDGLQNLSLARDVGICVIDGERRFGNGRLLPAGPLREPSAALGDTDFVVCNGGAPRAGEVPMRLVGDVAVALAGAEPSRALDAFATRRVHALAGIGHPARFFAHLRAHGIDVIEHALPDHHAISAADLAFAENLPVLMTEKDAVKCAHWARADWWCVPVRAELPEAFLEGVAGRLRTTRTTESGR